MPVIGQSLYGMASALGANHSKKEPVREKSCHNINRRCPSLGLGEDAAAICNMTLVSGKWPSRTTVDTHVKNGNDGGKWMRCSTPHPQKRHLSLNVGPTIVGRTGCGPSKRALRGFVRRGRGMQPISSEWVSLASLVCTTSETFWHVFL